MQKTLYGGNLPFSTTEEELQEAFQEHGTVNAVRLVADRETGRPRGFGFVEMDAEGATAAMAALNGTDFGGRILRIDEAKERADRGERQSGSGW